MIFTQDKFINTENMTEEEMPSYINIIHATLDKLTDPTDECLLDVSNIVPLYEGSLDINIKINNKNKNIKITGIYIITVDKEINSLGEEITFYTITNKMYTLFNVK